MSYLRSCEKCQSEQTLLGRQLMACGWIPRLDDPDVAAVQFDGLHGTEPGKPALTVCPGYTVRLPQVAETLRARIHWERGTLADRYDGEPLTGALMDALELSEGAITALQAEQDRQRREETK